MYPLKTLLHPTDETKDFSGAWKLTLLLAQDHGAEIVVAHVIPPPAAAYSEVDVAFQQPSVTPFEDLEVLRQTYVSETGVKIRHVVDQGDAGEAIIRIAEKENASMIVMGTHGRKGLGRFVMGSVAEHVVRRAKCPVMTVKSDWTP
jgi:nucleotide-binding universal stress UspA family protein